MILVLQTNVSGIFFVWLLQQKKIITAHSVHVEWHGSDQALFVVDAVLQKNKRKVTDITKVIVARGPGSFTAVRTGLLIANTLSTLLRIPVVGVVTKHQLTEKDIIRLSSTAVKVGNIVKPWYGKSPNITKAKPLRPQATANR